MSQVKKLQFSLKSPLLLGAPSVYDIDLQDLRNSRASRICGKSQSVFGA
jgi:hypothetical protein